MQLSAFIAVALLAIVEPQSTHQRVHDFANLLSPADRRALEQLAHKVEQETTAQVAVVTVQSLDGLTVDAYALELFNKWGIGQLETNNGVLFLIAPNERRMRIVVGYGLERLLPDVLCAEIRDTAILPRFKQQDFAGGIMAGTKALTTVLLSNTKAAQAGSKSELIDTPSGCQPLANAATQPNRSSSCFASTCVWRKQCSCRFLCDCRRRLSL